MSTLLNPDPSHSKKLLNDGKYEELTSFPKNLGENTRQEKRHNFVSKLHLIMVLRLMSLVLSIGHKMSSHLYTYHHERTTASEEFAMEESFSMLISPNEMHFDGHMVASNPSYHMMA